MVEDTSSMPLCHGDTRLTVTIEVRSGLQILTSTHIVCTVFLILDAFPIMGLDWFLFLVAVINLPEKQIKGGGLTLAPSSRVQSVRHGYRNTR